MGDNVTKRSHTTNWDVLTKLSGPSLFDVLSQDTSLDVSSYTFILLASSIIVVIIILIVTILISSSNHRNDESTNISCQVVSINDQLSTTASICHHKNQRSLVQTIDGNIFHSCCSARLHPIFPCGDEKLYPKQLPCLSFNVPCEFFSTQNDPQKADTLQTKHTLTVHRSQHLISPPWQHVAFDFVDPSGMAIADLR